MSFSGRCPCEHKLKDLKVTDPRDRLADAAAVQEKLGKAAAAGQNYPVGMFWEVVLAVAGILAVVVTGGAKSSANSVLARCSCDDDTWGLDTLTRLQLLSDFFIALAYFSIPLELLYFVSCSKVFPFRWILIQFGAFIVLCGLTHFISIWTYGPHSFFIMLVQTVLKVLTALVSCATAITLVHLIPELLQVKVREHFLRHKAEELDREMDIIKTQEEAGRHVRMLTHEIRSSLDRHTILNTTLVELAKTLCLENCTIWMPNYRTKNWDLTHELEERRVGPLLVSVSGDDPIVSEVVSCHEALVIPSKCSLARASNPRPFPCATAAVRLPLLHISFFNAGAPEIVDASFAIMVLVLPGASDRLWRPHELEMAEGVADQVAVALSHAAVLEESQRTRDQLIEQNKALQQARLEAETAIRARNDFLAVMNHEMRTPMHAIIALSSLLQESTLNPEQKSMVETVVKSSSLLSTLINDVLDFSRLEDGSLTLELGPFDLPMVLREAGNLAKPMARGKGLDFLFEIADDVPVNVIGDDKRLLQTALNVVGNAVKFTKQGRVHVLVTVESPGNRRDPDNPSWRPSPCEGFTYIRIEVRDTGLGVKDSDIPRLFQKFVQADSTTTRDYGGTGLGLAISKKFVHLMHGHIWIESKGLGQGSTVTFIVRLQLQSSSIEKERKNREEVLNKADLKGLKVLVTDDNSVNRIVTRRLLDRLGCNTTVVESGHQCLATLSQPGKSFEVLLLDLCMPEMDGYEVAMQIHQRFRPEERPLVIALTANTDKGTQKRCLDIGMDGVVLKPISLGEMSAALCKVLLQKARPLKRKNGSFS